MKIPLPRLLDSGGGESRRIHPISLNITENIIPLSTASMIIRAADSIPDRSFVELFTINGSAGIYRASIPQDGYGSPTSSVSLEHALTEIGDYIIKADIEKTVKALSLAISQIFACYSGSKWQIGTVISGNVSLEAKYGDNLLTTINSLVKQVPGAMISCDFTTTPWTLNITSKGTTVAAEGRLARNVRGAYIKKDYHNLCTRVYCEGLGTDGAVGYMDADTVSIYGIVEKKISGSGYTQQEAQAAAGSYLAIYKRPAYSVIINGRDFSKATGETLDRVEMGKLYRLAIPEDSVTVEENIIKLQWPDVYGNPEDVEITLAEEEKTLVTFIKKTNEDTSEQLNKTNEKIDENYDELKDYTDEGDATLAQTIEEKDEEYSARFEVTETAITAEVTRAQGEEESLSASLQLAAEAITAEVTRATGAEAALSTAITVAADGVKAEAKQYTDGQLTNYSTISATATAISAYVRDNAYQKQSGIDIKAEGIEISGSTYIKIKTGGSFSVDGGNFSVDDQGNVTAKSIKTKDEQGADTTVDLTSYAMWKLNYATVKNITVSGGQVTIITTAGSTTFNTAGSVTLTGSWSGAKFTVEASNGQTREESFSTSIGTGNSQAGGLRTINTFDSNHKAYGSVSATSLQVPLFTFNVDASSEYSAGVTAGAAAVTISAAGWVGGSNVVSASNGRSVTVNLPTITLSGGTSFDSSHETTVYASGGGASGYLASLTVDASSVYSAGESAGYSDGQTAGSNACWNATSISVGAWSGGSCTVTVTSGSHTAKTQTVNLPSITMGQDSWDSSHEKYVYCYGGGVSGYINRIKVDAESEYNAGWVRGYNVAVNKCEIRTGKIRVPKTTSEHGSAPTEDWDVDISRSCSWDQPAQYNIRANISYTISVGGAACKSGSFSYSHGFKADGGIN